MTLFPEPKSLVADRATIFITIHYHRCKHLTRSNWRAKRFLWAQLKGFAHEPRGHGRVSDSKSLELQLFHIWEDHKTENKACGHNREQGLQTQIHFYPSQDPSQAGGATHGCVFPLRLNLSGNILTDTPRGVSPRWFQTHSSRQEKWANTAAVTKSAHRVARTTETHLPSVWSLNVQD